MTEAINSKFQSLVAMENLQNRNSSNLKSFQSLRNVSETNNVDQLSDVADQFEAIFINQILKQSREIKLSEDLFGSSATKTYEQLLDRETSENVANRVNVGIADALVRQLGGNRDAE